MQALILVMIVAVTCFQFLISGGWLPGPFSYVPELLSVIVAAYVVVRGVDSRFKYVRPAYWVILLALLIGAICGAVVSRLEPGPMFAGLRTYLRALPFFFLPAVMAITERQIRAQLLVLLGICVLQLPLAMMQRMNTLAYAGYRGREATTGDHTVGTLVTSGNLTLFQIAAACILTGLYIRRFISGGRYLLLVLVILLPTALNETKITIILLPVALLITVFIGSTRENRFRHSVLGIGVSVAFLMIFVPIYDYFMMPRWGYGLLDFFTMEGRVERYLMSGKEIGEEGRAGRVDSFIAAVTVLAQDPTRAFFGLGIGNTSDSALGKQFVGAYFALLEGFPLTSLSVIMLELGIFGLILVLSLHWRIFRDCVDLAHKDNGLSGALAIGWAGVSVTIVTSLLYITPVTTPSFSYLYWYFSGLLVAAGARFGSRQSTGQPAR